MTILFQCDLHLIYTFMYRYITLWGSVTLDYIGLVTEMLYYGNNSN